VLTSFWSGLGGKLAERWTAVVLTPAFGFWLIAALAWVWSTDRDDVRRLGWTSAIDQRLEGLTHASGFVQAMFVVVALLVVVGTGLAARKLALPVLRFLEGYWRLPLLAGVGRKLREHHAKRMEKDASRWRALHAKGIGRLDPDEVLEFQRMDMRLLRVPRDPKRILPTRLGNILRVAESRPGDRYGLDAVTCWPRLWLLLPENTRTQIATARERLDIGAEVWLYSLVTVALTPVAWWALPLGVASALVTNRVMLLQAAQFGDLVQATFDVHRGLLYNALRWPLPANPKDERDSGQAMTKYLRRGATGTEPEFERSKPS
jgi:hypothetical protein